MRGNDLIEVRKLYNSNQLLHCVGTDRNGDSQYCASFVWVPSKSGRYTCNSA